MVEKSDPKPHALIIANGTLPDPYLIGRLVRHADAIICADGGANQARKLGIRPDVILGDFDSITPQTRAFYRAIEQIVIEDQESTDLEKAISYSIGKRMKSLSIIGASGDRIDHTVSGLGCFKKFGRSIEIRSVDPTGELSLIRNDVVLEMREGEKLSLLPLERCEGVTTENLKYALLKEALEPGVRDGISNEAISRHVRIHVNKGMLLLYRFHPPSVASEHRVENGPSRSKP